MPTQTNCCKYSTIVESISRCALQTYSVAVIPFVEKTLIGLRFGSDRDTIAKATGIRLFERIISVEVTFSPHS